MKGKKQPKIPENYVNLNYYSSRDRVEEPGDFTSSVVSIFSGFSIYQIEENNRTS